MQEWYLAQCRGALGIHTHKFPTPVEALDWVTTMACYGTETFGCKLWRCGIARARLL